MYLHPLLLIPISYLVLKLLFVLLLVSLIIQGLMKKDLAKPIKQTLFVLMLYILSILLTMYFFGRFEVEPGNFWQYFFYPLFQ